MTRISFFRMTVVARPRKQDLQLCALQNRAEVTER
jgi:hypothetical protein